MSINTFAIILIAFLDLTKPDSNNAKPPSIKNIKAAQRATHTVSIALVKSG